MSCSRVPKVGLAVAAALLSACRDRSCVRFNNPVRTMHVRRGWRAVVGNTTTRSLRSVDRATVGRVWSFAKPHGAGIVLVLLVVTAQSLVGLLPPLFYRHFIDTILPDKDLRLLVTFSAYLLALPVATVLLGLVQQLLIVRIGETLVYDLRNAMFDHVQQLSMRFYTSTRAGEIVARFTQDVEGARRMLTGTLPQLMTAFVTLASTLVVMMQLEWRLTLPGLLLFPALWPFAWWMARILRPIHHKTMEHNANLSSMVNETLSVNGASLMSCSGRRREPVGSFAAWRIWCGSFGFASVCCPTG